MYVIICVEKKGRNNMLLDIYLGTAVISLVTTFILTRISENKLKAGG